MGKRNKNKQPNRYTGKNIDMMGDVAHMERHALDVFRDMSRGRFNPNLVTEFLNKDFVRVAIVCAQKEHRKNAIILNALNYSYGTSNDADVIQLINRYISTCRGWEYIISSLYTVFNTSDLGTVYGMAQRLSSDRELRL